MVDDNDTAERAALGPDLTLETRASEEYCALEEALDALEESDERPPQDDLWRVLGNLLAWELRERFKTRAGVDQPAETACIRRLITGADECSCSDTRSWVDREREQIGAREAPPHQPPYADHSTLWLDETGAPAVYSMHVYPGNVLAYTPSKTADPEQQQRNGWFDIINWAEHWGLAVDIASVSWYNPFRTVNILFYPPEHLRRSDE